MVQFEGSRSNPCRSTKRFSKNPRNRKTPGLAYLLNSAWSSRSRGQSLACPDLREMNKLFRFANSCRSALFFARARPRQRICLASKANGLKCRHVKARRESEGEAAYEA